MTRQTEVTEAGIAEVVAPGIDRIFHYTIPEKFKVLAVPGIRVRVSLGRRTVTGYLVGTKEESDYPKLKPLSDLLDSEPLLPPQMLKLTRWISEYYLAPWGSVIRAVLPSGMDEVRTVRVSLTQEGKACVQADPLFDKIRTSLSGHTLTTKQLETKTGKRNIKAHLNQYCKQGLLLLRKEIRKPVRSKSETIYRLAVDPLFLEQNLAEIQKRSPSQARILQALQGRPGPWSASEIREQTGAKSGVIRTLVEKSLLIRESRDVFRDPFPGEKIVMADPPDLSPEQEAAVEPVAASLKHGRFETFLLYGVTGSGKTEIYLRAIEIALSQQKEAIVIVPEIALTPQLIRIFHSRFGKEIAVLHSGLSDGERYDQWNRIRKGEVSIAVGARSAIFAPFTHLGLIVVDEEHDATYKQEEVPRYHARDLAVVRGKMSGATVILGSATPSVESFYHAHAGKYQMLTMEKRIEDRPMPEICLIDMKQERGAGLLSPKLAEAVKQGLERHEQVLLFLNRRGYAPFLLCSKCGYVHRCPNCSVSLTYHMKEQEVCCHHCGYTTTLTNICPECKAESLELKGSGTERIEKEVQDTFEGSSLLRLDRDTTRTKGAAQKILDQFRSGQGNILIGTQMVAKGHHLPGISTVGVLNADTSLNFPDFRSGERTFQILTQVAGRSGRGASMGKVYLQSYTPEHYSIQAARNHDYQSFFDQEILFRKALNYPPFCRLINLILSANSLQKVKEAAAYLGKILRDQPLQQHGIEVLGPAKAPLFTLRGKKRYQILVKGRSVRSLHRIVEQGVTRLTQTHGFSGVDLTVDVDPVNFL